MPHFRRRNKCHPNSCSYSSGTEVVRGVIFVGIDDSGRVSGFWDLRQVDPGATMIGPQIGRGTLEGFSEDTSVWMNLNPEYADNNVFLYGTMSRAGIYGRWQYVGFPGVLSSGEFRALKHPDRRELPSER